MPTPPVFLSDPGAWADLAAVIRDAGVCGWDTETYGHDVRTTTPAYRALVDEWSLAVPTGAISPRGHRVWRGFGLPRTALESGPLRAVLEDLGVPKIAHNARHDVHGAANHGVTVRGWVDTLETARLVWPGRLSYGLKALRVDVLGKPGRDGFKDLTAPQIVKDFKPYRGCRCGLKGCRRSKSPHLLEDLVKEVERKVPCPIEGITPGHPRRAAKESYMIEDAVDAGELWDVARARLVAVGRALPELPW